MGKIKQENKKKKGKKKRGWDQIQWIRMRGGENKRKGKRRKEDRKKNQQKREREGKTIRGFRFSLRSTKIGSWVFVEVKGKVDPPIESYAWVPKSWSFVKLHEIENFPT